jgi:hypothetical protein
LPERSTRAKRNKKEQKAAEKERKKCMGRKE